MEACLYEGIRGDYSITSTLFWGASVEIGGLAPSSRSSNAADFGGGY